MPTLHTGLSRVHSLSGQPDLRSIRTTRPVRGGLSLTVAAVAVAAVVVVSAALANTSPEAPGPGVLDTASPAVVATAPETETLDVSTRIVNGAAPAVRPIGEQVRAGTPVSVTVATDRPERVRLRGSPGRTTAPGPARPATITFVAAGPDSVVVEVERTSAPLVVIAVTDAGGPNASGL